MTDEQTALFFQICRNRKLRVSPEGDTLTVLFELLSSLSLVEIFAIFQLKQSLFQVIKRDVQRVSEDPLPSELVDLICLIQAISTFKRPSDFMGRKYDGPFPNLAQLYLDSKIRGKRKSKIEALLRVRHKVSIMKWRKQGHSFRAIAKALGKEPNTPEYSEASISRVVKKWEAEQLQEDSNEHE